MNYESGGSNSKDHSTFLEKLVNSILFEFVFWIFAGLLLLATYGGVWGIVIAVVLGGFLALVYLSNRTNNNKPQSNERNNKL